MDVDDGEKTDDADDDVDVTLIKIKYLYAQRGRNV